MEREKPDVKEFRGNCSFSVIAVAVNFLYEDRKLLISGHDIKDFLVKAGLKDWTLVTNVAGVEKILGVLNRALGLNLRQRHLDIFLHQSVVKKVFKATLDGGHVIHVGLNSTQFWQEEIRGVHYHEEDIGHAILLTGYGDGSYQIFDPVDYKVITVSEADLMRAMLARNPFAGGLGKYLFPSSLCQEIYRISS